MPNKRGTGLMMVWCDVPAEAEEEFNHWYNTEHLQELLSVPGVLNAARYEATSSGPQHLAMYELESVAVVVTPMPSRTVHPRPGARKPARGRWRRR